MFVGKDFLKMQPPKDYKPGIGRGALGFSTRGNIGFDTTQPIDDNAADIYANIDKRKKRHELPQEPDRFADAEQINEQDWLSIPEATDTTFRNKRLRMEQQMQRRSYNLPDSMIQLETSGPNFARLTRVDPTNPQGWIGYAKQEQDLQHFKKARSIIQKGCAKCPHAPEVWETAIDLSPRLDEQRVIASNAVEANPQSIELWEKAVEIEPLDSNKLKVTHSALESNPKVEKLWIMAAKYESDPNTRKMVLKQAVALVPSSEALWLEYYMAASDEKVLDEGLDVLPQSVPLWSLKLYLHKDSEHNYLVELVSKLPDGDWPAEINKNPDSTQVAALVIDKFAISPESMDHPTTKDLAFKSLATKDANAYKAWANQGSVQALEKLLEIDPSPETYELLVKQNPSIVAMERAYKAFPDHFISRYIDLLDNETARGVLGSYDPKTVALWLRYAEMLDPIEATVALKQALVTYPHAGELYMSLYKIENDEKWLQKGVEMAPQLPELWIEWSRLDIPLGRRRALLVQGMTVNPGSELLWVERILVEKRAGMDIVFLLDQALKECESSGRLWYLYLENLNGIKRKAKYAEALTKTNKDKHVLYSLAKFHQSRGKDSRDLLAQAITAKEWCDSAGTI